MPLDLPSYRVSFWLVLIALPRGFANSWESRDLLACLNLAYICHSSLGRFSERSNSKDIRDIPSRKSLVSGTYNPPTPSRWLFYTGLLSLLLELVSIKYPLYHFVFTKSVPKRLDLTSNRLKGRAWRPRTSPSSLMAVMDFPGNLVNSWQAE